jgi:hypothetical protein
VEVPDRPEHDYIGACPFMDCSLRVIDHLDVTIFPRFEERVELSTRWENLEEIKALVSDLT